MNSINNVLTYLQQLGFSATEAKLYIILLKSGPITVAALAEKSNTNRTAAYAHINSLLLKGIITKVKGSTNKIAANSPDYLHNLVEQKAIQIGMLQEKLPSVISLLNSSISTQDHSLQSEMKYYKGKNGARAIYSDMFKAKEIRSYFNPVQAVNVFPENAQLFENALTQNKRLRIFEIIEDTKVARKQMTMHSQHKGYHYKFLPNDVKLTSNDILIYDGKVAIINIRDKNSVEGVVLENRDYYNNSVQLFDLLWRLLPEPKI